MQIKLFLLKRESYGSGTHDELLRTHDMYREFATQQLKIKGRIIK